MFEEKLGPNIPLNFHLKFKDTDIRFGDDCVFLDYTLILEVSDHTLGLETVFFDELKVQSVLSITLKNDHFINHIIELQLNSNDRYSQTTAPHFASFPITHNEYQTFVEDFALMLYEIKQYWNDVVFLEKIPNPYDVPQFYETLHFIDGVMYMELMTFNNYKNSWS